MSKAESESEPNEQVSSASEQANGRASCPVLISEFLVDLAHSAEEEQRGRLSGGKEWG